MSKAWKQFDQTMKRAESMLSAAMKLPKAINADPKELYFQDSIRASVVIAVASMDAFFTNKFVEILVEFLKKHGPTEALIELLQKAGLDTRESLGLLAMEHPYRRIRSLVEIYFEKLVTQKFEVIDELYIGFSLKNLSANALKKMRVKKAQGSIESLIKRRHQIVHEGDVNNNGNIRQIEPIEILNCFEVLKIFIKEANAIIELRINSLKQNKT